MLKLTSMNLGIVHFTDIHFTKNTDLGNKTVQICNAILREFSSVDNIIFVVSGDIACSGTAIEYKKAKGFFSVLKQLLTGERPNLKIDYVFVPGNHDCNLGERDTQLRKNAVANVNYQTLGSDDSVIDLCLEVQQEFWNFYSDYSPIPTNKLYYQVNKKVGNKVISFACLNTAWMS